MLMLYIYHKIKSKIITIDLINTTINNNDNDFLSGICF